MSSNTPQMIIVGGPNGAGKTTLVLETMADLGLHYLGADHIAAEMRPEFPESVALEAGRQFILQFNQLVESKTGFVVESTLAGRSFRKSIVAAKSEGYVIVILFVFVNSAHRSILRVAERVRRGGHHVPDADVQRRFQRCLSNFWNLYRPLADRWSLAYNEYDRIDVAEGVGDEVVVYDQEAIDLFHNLRIEASDDL